MGKLPNGPLGAFTGRLGNLVCYPLNGQIIVRTIGKNDGTPSFKQKTNRMKMKLTTELINDTYLAMHAGFTAASVGTVYNYANLAVKHNNPNALKGVYPNVEVDYPKVLFSHGALMQPVDPKVELVEEGLKFSWDPTTQSSGMAAVDQISMIAYCPEKKTMAFIKSGQKRHQGFDILPINSSDLGSTLEVYMYFVSDDRMDVSTTIYLGRVSNVKILNGMDEPLVIEQVYNTPIDQVWEALTDQKAMKSWYVPELDKFKPVVGSQMKFEDDGSSFNKSGQVTQVLKERKLAHTWSYQGYPGCSEVTFELIKEKDKTRLRLTHSDLASFPNDDPHFARNRFEDSWHLILTMKLKQYLERES